MQELNHDRYTRQGREMEKFTIGKGANQAQVYKYREALNFAHKVGLIGFETEFIIPLCNPAVELYVAHAVAKFADGSSFSGLGDANPANVNANVARHMPRMAETRAKARALGDALNLDANFSDEFGGDDTDESETFTPKPAAAKRQPAASASRQAATSSQADFNAPPFNNGSNGYECEECGSDIKDSAKWSAAQKANFSL